jgi:hypothetical protein
VSPILANKRTGELDPAKLIQRGVSIPNPTRPGQKLTLWADPGWDYNSGQAGAIQANLAWVEAQKMAQAAPELSQAVRMADTVGMETIRATLVSPEFKAFFNNDTGSPDRFAVAILNTEERVLFNSQGSTVWLSRRSLDEHKEKHPEVAIEDYQSIPDIIQNAKVWAGHKARRYLLLWIGGKPYRAAIKTDANGIEVWFLSLVISGKQKPPKWAVRVR